jgi:uncharacterized membrane protein YccF (DUF307 family)
MKTIGNILWFVLCGVWMGLAYLLAGLVSCITIIGIPLAIANLKMIPVSLMPLGKDIVAVR